MPEATVVVSGIGLQRWHDATASVPYERRAGTQNNRNAVSLADVASPSETESR